jgi:hypothetical protein
MKSEYPCWEFEYKIRQSVKNDKGTEIYADPVLAEYTVDDLKNELYIRRVNDESKDNNDTVSKFITKMSTKFPKEINRTGVIDVLEMNKNRQLILQLEMLLVNENKDKSSA